MSLPFSPSARAGRIRRHRTPVTSDRAKLLAIALVFCFAAAAEGRPGFQPAPSFAPPNPAVVRVVAPDRDGMSLGSGSLVEVNEYFGLVVTNWHVVRDAAGTVGVIFPDGFRSAATILRVDRDWDLAALAIWRPKVRPIAISNQPPRPGEMLTIAGYGSGPYRAVSGPCTQYVSPGDNFPFEMVELAAPARQGDSGGPILNSRGELVGVLFGSSFGKTSGSYCLRLRAFLAPVLVAFQQLNRDQMLARRTPREPAPLASIGALQPAAKEAPAATPLSDPPSPAFAAQPSPLPTARRHCPPAAEKPAYEAPAPHTTVPPPVAAIPRPVPNSTNDQIKTILAAIGIMAIAYCALRVLGWAVG